MFLHKYANTSPTFHSFDCTRERTSYMMLPAKDYVPNTEKRIKFFKKEAERKIEPKIWGKTIISIEDHKPKAVSSSRRKNIEAVTTQQTVEHAKSELLRKTHNHLTKRPLFKKKKNELGEIYNKPRQTRAKKVVLTWDSSGF